MHTTGYYIQKIYTTLDPISPCHRFILVDIGDVGRHSDGGGGVLSNSSFGQALEEHSLSIPDASPIPGKKRSSNSRG